MGGRVRARMLADLEPVARDLGCSAELAGVQATLDVDASYQRQLAAVGAAASAARDCRSSTAARSRA